jgi:hypothetical protein
MMLGTETEASFQSPVLALFAMGNCTHRQRHGKQETLSGEGALQRQCKTSLASAEAVVGKESWRRFCLDELFDRPGW